MPGFRIQYQGGKPILKRQALSVFLRLCEEGQQEIPHASIEFVDAHDVEHLLKLQNLRNRWRLFHPVSPECIGQAGDLPL
jgi:hypothetical protein